MRAENIGVIFVRKQIQVNCFTLVLIAGLLHISNVFLENFHVSRQDASSNTILLKLKWFLTTIVLARYAQNVTQDAELLSL